MAVIKEEYAVFSSMTDEAVVLIAQNSDALATEYILNKYKGLVKSKARAYFLIGADREDIVQEGMIGLYKAIRDFRADRLSSFSGFAELCTTRQIVTAIKTATRRKHAPLNTYISLNKPVFDDETERNMFDVLCENEAANPEQIVINEESYSTISGKIAESLSIFERKVLSSYLQGKSYQCISAELKRPVKSIDNALQRIKRKLEIHLELDFRNQTRSV